MKTLIGIGQYLKDDYDEILRISIDRDNLDQTWEEWKKNKERAKNQFQNSGLQVVGIVVKPEELVNYCRLRGLEIDGKSRSAFISYKTSLLNK